MKVLLIVTTSAVGGAPKVAYDLANGLIQDGDQVAVIAPNDGMYFEMFKNITNDVWDIQLRKFRLKNLLEIRSIISKLKPDVIHTHGKAAGLYGRTAGINSAPVIHTLHGLHYKHYSPTAQFCILE